MTLVQKLKLWIDNNGGVTLSNAFKFAQEAHLGKFRNDGVTEYYTHPCSVALRAISYHTSEKIKDLKLFNIIILCMFHDVIEDTSVTYADIETFLISENVSNDDIQIIIAALRLLTKDKLNKKTNVQYYLDIKTNKYASFVKTFDMIDNISDTPTSYMIKKYSIGLNILNGTK